MNSSPNPFSSFLPRLSRRALLLGVLVGGAVGCQPALEGEVEEAWTVVQESLRVANSLTTRALVFNAVTTNPTASAMLSSSSLQSLFPGNTYLQRQLFDADARLTMSYLVSCALDAGSWVDWTATMPPSTPATPNLTGIWRGELGLCPEWKTGAPSLECKARVSACMLARNNAVGRRVELSMRGEDASRPALFSLETVSAPMLYDPVTDVKVPSFLACTGVSSATSRDCGWRGDGIGRCVPGQTVRLGAGAPAPDQCEEGPVLGAATGAPMMLRVCADLAGCDHGSARRLTTGAASCGTPNPSVSFTCPASGYFNVLKQTVSTQQTGTVAVQEEMETPAMARYPLSESEVFSVREGAYYGNIFDPNALAAKVSVDKDFKIIGKEENIQGSVYRKMFSCQAPGWSEAAAYAANRLCALPSSGSNCAAIPTGTCVSPTAPAYPNSRCATADGTLVAGDQDYEKCRDTTGTLWSEPITVFLHGPCDVLDKSASAACRRDVGAQR